MAVVPEENKQTKADEKKGSDKALVETVSKMPVTADDSMGTFTEDAPEEELFDKPDVEKKTGKVSEKFGDYQKEMFEDIKKNPDQYLVKTSRGEMSIKDAYDAGWDPKTDTFGKERTPPDKEEIFGGLSEGDRAAVDEFTDPSKHQPPDALREQLGMGAPPAPPQGGMPLGEGMPTGGEAPMEGGGNPLEGLLGGGNM